MNGRVFGAALVGMALGACGGGAPVSMNDSGIVVPTDAGGGMCAHPIPNPDPNVVSPRYGTLANTSFQEFGIQSGATFTATPLPDCDGTPHAFYAEQYCNASHRFTVISIAAGWCNPCMQESSLMRDQLDNAYGPRGVRVIQILVQDAQHNAPTGPFCNQWRSSFNLTTRPDPMTGLGNYELYDPMQITNQYFPDGYLPSTLIVDNHGVIRWHQDGLDAQNGQLTGITNELDQLLAGP